MLRFWIVALVALVAGCAGAPAEPPPAEAHAATVEPVACEPAPEPEPPPKTYDPALREAHRLYVNGDIEQAMLAYERILAAAEEPRDQLSALIALGLIRLLPSSPMRDVEVAGLILDEIEKRIGRSDLYYAFFGQIELLKQIQAYQARIVQLQGSKQALEAELGRKEEAIRKLRELTVGGNL